MHFLLFPCLSYLPCCDLVWSEMMWYEWCDVIWCDVKWHDVVWNEWDNILSYDVIFHMMWYDMMWYEMMWYDMMWYDMMWYDMMWWWNPHILSSWELSHVSLFDTGNSDWSAPSQVLNPHALPHQSNCQTRFGYWLSMGFGRIAPNERFPKNTGLLGFA